MAILLNLRFLTIEISFTVIPYLGQPKHNPQPTSCRQGDHLGSRVSDEYSQAPSFHKQITPCIYYYFYKAFISRHVSHQFGNAKAHINKHTHVKSI